MTDMKTTTLPDGQKVLTRPAFLGGQAHAARLSLREGGLA